MPNPIKYTTGTETLALKKGNFYIGTGDVGKGPSDVTGFYQGLSPSEGGYVIYMNREGAPGDLSYHNAPTDNDLITFTNNLAGQSYTTVNECLVYFAGQSDKVCLNRDYEGIITDGLIFNLDAGFTPSYPRSGTTWYDVGGTNNGTLINGPTFNSGNGGSIMFDGVDDFTQANGTGFSAVGDCTLEVWAKSDNYVTQTGIFANKSYYSLGEGVAIGNISIPQRVGFTIKTNSEVRVFFFTNGSTYGWSHFVGVKYGDEVRTYTNGVLVSTNTYSGSITSDSDNLSIGRYLGYGNHWDGEVAVAKAYNRALSITEVLQNYNAQKGRFGL